MARRTSIILMSLILLCDLSGHMAWSSPAQDYTLLGLVTVNGVTLTTADPDFGDYSIFLQVEELPGETLVTYVMGSTGAFGDYYVLKVPMSTPPRDAGRALTGDTAHIGVTEL